MVKYYRVALMVVCICLLVSSAYAGGLEVRLTGVGIIECHDLKQEGEERNTATQCYVTERTNYLSAARYPTNNVCFGLIFQVIGNSNEEIPYMVSTTSTIYGPYSSSFNFYSGLDSAPAGHCADNLRDRIGERFDMTITFQGQTYHEVFEVVP